jgi:HEAT repeat protein
MTPCKSFLLAAALACRAAAQEPAPPKPPVPVVEPRAPRPPKPPTIHGSRGRSGDGRYDRGTSAIDAGRWDDARQIFDEIANAKDSRADGALYWKAYSENRLGRRDDALATLAVLRQQYPQSDWLNDAQALQIEIQQQAGKPVDPNAQADEDIKMMAIAALMNSDPERAIPILDKFLKSTSSPRLKNQALFVLSQSRSPQAQQLLLSIAKGGSNPDLQLRALRNLAMAGTKNAAPDIASIYSASHNQAIKKQALNSLFMAKASDELYNIARNEQDAGLRDEAVRNLSLLHQTDKLSQLYQAGIAKKSVLESMFLAGEPQRLLEIIRTEKDPQLRASAIRSLGLMHSSQAGDGLIALYPSEQDLGVKKQIVEALWLQRNAKALVDIARKESNVEMKKEIVQKLMMLHSKEANDYMMELLK